uniref:Chalcone/stilbene synthase C-terminal domain-containing protein n=1 Tax=Populus davidiana TaxID=266767 RepID=A0A6M2E785_9ROSI
MPFILLMKIRWVASSLFGDGAAIIGSDPETLIEKPILQLVSAAQVMILDSVGEMELSIHLSEDAHKLITINVDAALQEVFTPIGGGSVIGTRFFGLFIGGRATLDEVESKLGLKEEKLGVARHTLSAYGNVASACVYSLYMIDEGEICLGRLGHYREGLEVGCSNWAGTWSKP